jgi:PAS domain-containing protein
VRLKQLGSEPGREEAELIVWVRGAQNEIEEHGELNERLREFATELLKRGLIAKVQFLEAMEFSDSAAVGAKSSPIYSQVTNWKFFANALDAIVVTKQETIKFTGRLFIWLKHLKLILQRAPETLTTLVWSAASKPRRLLEAIRGWDNYLRNLIVVMKQETIKFTGRLFVWLKHLNPILQPALESLPTLVRSAANKPRRLREAIRGKDNYLGNLLTTPFEAIVLADEEHRFVQANARALDLFGISERNITMFTMDAFLQHRQIAELDENDAPFVYRRERHGECEIQRLDGSLLVAEYTFVSNVAVRRHLYRFQGLAPRRRMPVSYGQRHWAMN